MSLSTKRKCFIHFCVEKKQTKCYQLTENIFKVFVSDELSYFKYLLENVKLFNMLPGFIIPPWPYYMFFFTLFVSIIICMILLLFVFHFIVDLFNFFNIYFKTLVKKYF